MQLSSNFTLLYPRKTDWDRLIMYRPDIPFSDDVVEFLNALSGALLKDCDSRIYPDVITFAFFCRRANLQRLKGQYIHSDNLRIGRGMLFHIAPSNVPINFAYSLVAGLLAGNANIVRVSSKQFVQVDLIIKHLYLLMEERFYNEVASRIVLVRYDRTSDVTAYFSSIANVRVIWGGDATIATIRQNVISPRAFDVCFADRYSIAVINPVAIMQATSEEIKKLAVNFYNDTYLFDQNACSAPHLIFWLNNKYLGRAKECFWNAIYEYTDKKYQLQAVMSVDKLAAFYRQAACMDIRSVKMPDNVIVRAELQKLPKEIDDFRCACGYFSEYTINNLDEIAPIVTTKYQTLAYYGLNKVELIDFIHCNRLHGLDRVVPVGETTTFTLTWDGYNLIDTFTRIVSVL